MAIDRNELTRLMTELLDAALKRNAAEGHTTGAVTAESALLGPQAVLSSLNLVSFIMDVEAELSDRYGVDVTLVNESALSRKHSPFRSIATLSDYVLELAGDPAQTADSAAG